MKLLTLIRHAKSSWNHPQLSDHDRPLNTRGRHDAPMMGLHLEAQQLVINKILSSTATRAITTATLIAEPLGYPASEIETWSEIYAASSEQLLNVVQSQGDEAHIALVGHNPGISELARKLANSTTQGLPTCAVLQLVFSIDHWRDVAARSGEIRSYDTPKRSFPASQSVSQQA